MSKSKKLLMGDTVVVWNEIPMSDYRDYFKQAIGEDFTVKAGDMEFQTWLLAQTSKTLGEAVEEYLNPSGSKNVEELLQEKRFDAVSPSDKLFITSFDKAMSEFGYDFGGIIGSGYSWSKFMIIYGKTGTKSRPCAARIYISENEIALRLFLNKIDARRQYIEAAPHHIKEAFTGPYSDCRQCKTKCTPKEYTIDGRLMQKCDPFWFDKPSMEKLPDYVNLLSEFFPKKNH